MLSLCHYAKYSVLSDDSTRYIVIAINILSLLVAAPGNIITLAVIAKVRNLRKQPTYLFIGSVCLADALVATFSQPMYIAAQILESTDEYCTFYSVFFVVSWFSCFGSVVSLNMVTLDRFIYINYPLQYPRYMPRRRALLFIFLGWITVAFFSLTPVAWLSSIALHSLLLTHNFVSCILVGITYQRIYKKARMSVCKHSTSFSQYDAVKDEASAQRQATRTVFIVVFFFVVCWGPWTVLSFMMSIKEQYVANIEAEYHAKAVKIAQSFSITLGCLSSVCNVFIYTFKNKALRKEWIKYICGKFKGRESSSVCQVVVDQKLMAYSLQEFK